MSILRFTAYLAQLLLAYRSVDKLLREQHTTFGSSTALRLTAIYAPLDLWCAATRVSRSETMRRQSIHIVNLFVLYVKAVDAYLDSQAGRAEFLINPKCVFDDPPFRHDFDTLLSASQALCPRSECRVAMDRTIRDFVSTATDACSEDIAANPAQDANARIQTLLVYREQTSGEMYRCFGRLLNLVHDVPPGRAALAEQLLARWAVAVQVLDDMLDATWDFPHEPNNIVWALLSAYPAEDEAMKHLVAEGKVFIPSQLRSHAPQAARHLDLVFDGYLAQIRALDVTDRAVRESAASVQHAYDGLCSPAAPVWLRFLMKLGAH